jgi:putative SOS response-associated peptidase YedK
MCGRFALFSSGEELRERYPFVEVPQLEPRYNIAPTQQVAAIRAMDSGRALSFLRWGLVPSWAADLAIGYKLLNARAETVAEKPSFRAAFKKRRCLIPASAYYEWQKADDGRKQPFAIRPRDGGLFSFALERVLRAVSKAKPVEDGRPVRAGPAWKGHGHGPSITPLASSAIRWP